MTVEVSVVLLVSAIHPMAAILVTTVTASIVSAFLTTVLAAIIAAVVAAVIAAILASVIAAVVATVIATILATVIATIITSILATFITAILAAIFATIIAAIISAGGVVVAIITAVMIAVHGVVVVGVAVAAPVAVAILVVAVVTLLAVVSGTVKTLLAILAGPWVVAGTEPGSPACVSDTVVAVRSGWPVAPVTEGVAGSGVVRAVWSLPEWKTDTLVLASCCIVFPVGMIGTLGAVERSWKSGSGWVWVCASETSQITLLLTGRSSPAFNASTLLAILVEVEELRTFNTGFTIADCGAGAIVADRVADDLR